MQEVWMIAYSIDDGASDFMICTDEQTALELYMSLVEEDMFDEFFWTCDDDLEDIDQDWEERAQWVNPWDSLWSIRKVPVYGNLSC